MNDNQTVDSRKKIPLDLSTLLTIEKVVFAEAGNQGQRGRDAVRAVIYNRVAAGVGGNDVLSVLNAKKQFQPVWEKAKGDATRLELPDRVRDSFLAEHMDFLRRGEDPTGGATFFLNKAVARNPFNVKFKGVKIGDHEFFDHYNGRRVTVPQYEVALRGGQRSTLAAAQEKPAKEEPNLFGRVKKYVGDLLPLSSSQSVSSPPSAKPQQTADTPTNFGPLKPAPQPTKATGPLAQRYEGELLPLRRGGYIAEHSIEDSNLKELEMGKVKMNCGGMMAPEYEIGYDEESGNPIPPGSLPSEVRDDIPAMLSEGEFVLPADVVRWHGLKHIMDMRAEAKMGLMAMTMDGLLHEGDPVEPEEIEEETETETPEGNKVTKVTPKIEEEGMELEEEEEGEDYAKMLEQPYGDERLIILMKSDPSIFRKT